jgi:hypothetical protein
MNFHHPASERNHYPVRFGPVSTKAEKWRTARFGLLVLIVLGILSHWIHPNNDHSAIPSQAWSFGEPGE